MTSNQARYQRKDDNTESESNSFPTTERTSNSNSNSKSGSRGASNNKQKQISKFKSEPNLNTETYDSEEDDNTSQLISASKQNKATLNIKNPGELTGMKRIIYDVLTNNNNRAPVDEGSNENSWSETTESVVNIFDSNDFICIYSQSL